MTLSKVLSYYSTLIPSGVNDTFCTYYVSVTSNTARPLKEKHKPMVQDAIRLPR